MFSDGKTSFETVFSDGKTSFETVFSDGKTSFETVFSDRKTSFETAFIDHTYPAVRRLIYYVLLYTLSFLHHPELPKTTL